MKIENIHIDPPSHPDYWQTVALGWRTAEARYHVWIDKNFNIARGVWHPEHHQTLYKNSLVNRGQPGHFDTRRLDATKNANSKMVSEVIRAAKEQDLLGKALAECQRREDQRLAEAAEEARIDRIKEAGPKLLGVLQELVAVADGLHHDLNREFDHAQWVIDRAHALIDELEGKQ